MTCVSMNCQDNHHEYHMNICFMVVIDTMTQEVEDRFEAWKIKYRAKRMNFLATRAVALIRASAVGHHHWRRATTF